MKTFLILAAAVFVVSAGPISEETGELVRQTRSLTDAEFAKIPLELVQEHGLRLKRFTCDALSFQSLWVTPNHSACAVHCLAKGFKGGQCVNTVCNCRR